MGETKKNSIETYFEWWLNELIEARYIHSYSREGEAFEVFPNYIGKKKEYFKTKEPKEKTFAILQKIKYTYDYKIVWNKDAEFIFYQAMDFSDPSNIQTVSYEDTLFYACHEEGGDRWVSYVDVKPPSQASRFSGKLNSYHTFPIKRAALLWLHRIYINKVIPIPMSGAGGTIALFPNSFTPKRYLLTDGATKTRSIKFRIVSLAKYVFSREDYINSIKNNLERIRSNVVRQNKLF